MLFLIIGISVFGLIFYWAFGMYTELLDRKLMDGTIPQWVERACNHSNIFKYAIIIIISLISTAFGMIGFLAFA